MFEIPYLKFRFILFLAFILNSQVDLIPQEFKNLKTIEENIAKIKSSPSLKGASYSWVFTDITSQKTLWEHQSDLLLCPASTLKLVTTAMALNTLGSSFRFQTNVFRTGEIENGILKGNLVIVGSGDPSLGSGKAGAKNADSLLFQLLNMLKLSGIKQIKGNIHLDDSCFPSNYKSIPADRQWEDVGNYYGTGIWGINWRNNSFELEIQNNGTAQYKLKSTPELKDYTFKAYLENKEKEDLYIYVNPWSNLIQIGGTLEHGKSATIKGAIPYPARQLGNEIKEMLTKNGVSLEGTLSYGQVKELETDAGMILLGTISSPELYRLIEEINVNSNNLFADCILRASAGSEFNQSGIEEIAANQKEKTSKLIQHRNSPVRMRDGSGMSRSNFITTKYIVDLLVYMAGVKEFELFRKSIPEPGKKGALRQFPLLKGLHAKSGSMAGVRAYAGYIKKADSWIAFSIMVNNNSLSWTEMNALFVPLFQSILDS